MEHLPNAFVMPASGNVNRAIHYLKLIFIPILICVSTASSLEAQVAARSTNHFEKNGLEFEYPATWKFAEGRGEDSEYVELAVENKTVQLIVSWQFEAVLDCEFEGARIRLTQALVERVASQIHTDAPRGTSWQEMRLAKTRSDHVQLRGMLNNVPVLADVYSLAIKHYFLNLVYLRVATDETASRSWETILATLKVNPPALLPKGKKPSDGGVLNGKAIRLPRPNYPAAARYAHVSGTVVVQVLISETGYVIAACAISGPQELQDVSVAAARGALFSPTKLSGKPLRVMGLVTYNFVAQ